nr:T9SS type A sorting domain-containing protein [Bacteroidota bacterium]
MIRNTQPRIGKPQKGVWGVFANQCPISGGTAVFKARAMLYLVLPNLKYDDRDICNRVGIEYRKGETTLPQIHPQIKVYPNPADDKLTIDYRIDEDCNLTLEVYSALGKQEIKISLSAKSQTITIPTSQYSQGIYLYRLLCNGNAIETGKFNINR